MYHRALEKDFKTIFGVSKVLFREGKIGAEQEVLLCNINKSSITIERGEERAVVEGDISIIGQSDNNLNGYFQKRMMTSDKKLLARFWFGRAEEQISMGGYEQFYNASTLNFIYFYKAEYNPQKEKITIKNFILKIFGIGDKK